MRGVLMVGNCCDGDGMMGGGGVDLKRMVDYACCWA